MTGALPVFLAVLQLGQADSSFDSVAQVVERGIREGVYPGAVVVVGRRDTVLYARGFGHATWATTAFRPSPADTRWDLASLTKVVATMSAVLVLVDHGRVGLDVPVARYLPRFVGRGRERITVRMLLDHTSGLPAYLPLYRLAKTRKAAVDLLYQATPIRTPGRVTEYSDLNAMLLGLLVERVAGAPLDQFAAQAVFTPLGMTATAFAPELPRSAPVAPSRRIGCCAVTRRVNDDNAFLLGGVAGHAGLFSTGLDLARFAQAWLRKGQPQAGGSPWVSSASLQRFLERAPGSERALGWDTPLSAVDSSFPSVFGAAICACAFGHTGWTGTMLWADPDRDLFLVFLTNRSLEPRVPNSLAAIRELRSELSDRVLDLARH